MAAELARGGTGAAPASPALIPQPLAQAPERGAFALGPEARIVVRSRARDAVRVGELLARSLRPATGYRLPVVAARPAAGDVTLALVAADTALGDEGYRLTVDGAGVTVVARRAAGLFWGTQTLRQLLPAAIEADGRRPGPWLVPRGTIHDRPRFAWRGAMLDVARHFFGVDDVRRLVDLMSLYKLNRLHLHLTDDQGWRLAIRSWPRLTSQGGRTQVGGGRGGYFTQRQYAALVGYAADRFVEVVPEIDMPGHVNAALSSYAKLSCDGRAAAPYTGIEVGFSSLCLRKPVTYAFVDDVVREVAALTPGRYVHIGGDEAHATDSAEYRTFVERVDRIVRAHGKRTMGWEEIGKTRLRRSTVVQHWQDGALAARAVSQGARLVLSPATKAYLDMKYAPGFPLGLSWAGTTTVREAYGWDPARQVPGVGEADVLGVEAPLWTETVTTRADLDLLVFPRLLGHAEVAWSPAAAIAWPGYRRRLAAQGPRLEALGVGYYRAPEVPWR